MIAGLSPGPYRSLLHPRIRLKITAVVVVKTPSIAYTEDLLEVLNTEGVDLQVLLVASFGRGLVHERLWMFFYKHNIFLRLNGTQ